MAQGQSASAIVAGLLLAVTLWGANNAGVKFLVAAWPPVWVGSTRFTCAGLLLWAVLRWTRWLEGGDPVPAELRRRLWWQGGLTLAVYIAAFNWAVHLTAVSHVALYLGAAPVWALLWEGQAGLSRRERLRRWTGTGLTVIGVAVLFGPALLETRAHWLGEVVGLGSSVLWTLYGRQCRALGERLSGPAITAHTMWRAGVWLAPLGAIEAGTQGVTWDARRLAVQLYCVVGGGVVAFALWNHALRHWPTSRVYLFSNLAPATTMLWARWTLGEPVSPTFWPALALIATGLVIAQTGAAVQPANAPSQHSGSTQSEPRQP